MIKIHPVSFKSGHTSLFTDFDGTYTPFSHDEMCKNSRLSYDEDYRKKFNKYFSDIKNFSDINKDKFTLTVTTGRNAAEYKFVEDKLKDKKLLYHSSQFLIVRDGGDKFLKENNEWKKDKSKTEKIKELTNGWNAEAIKNRIIKIIKQTEPASVILNVPVNRDEFCYENISLESALKDKNRSCLKNYVSFSENEDLDIEIVFSNHLNINTIKENVSEYLNSSKTKTSLSHYHKDKNVFIPQLNEQGEMQNFPAERLMIKPEIDGKPIAKIYDIKEKLSHIVNNETNDFVIAAGDEINDESMLNPLNYLDLYKITINPNQNIDDLLKDAAVIRALKELPFTSIIVGNSQSLEHLRELGKKLDEKGIQKIITVADQLDEKNGYLSAVKKAIYNYAEQNDEFSYDMGIDLYRAILKGGSKWL